MSKEVKTMQCRRESKDKLYSERRKGGTRMRWLEGVENDLKKMERENEG
jgi:hypothetical protein